MIKKLNLFVIFREIILFPFRLILFPFWLFVFILGLLFGFFVCLGISKNWKEFIEYYKIVVKWSFYNKIYTFIFWKTKRISDKIDFYF